MVQQKGHLKSLLKSWRMRPNALRNLNPSVDLNCLHHHFRWRLHIPVCPVVNARSDKKQKSKIIT